MKLKQTLLIESKEYSGKLPHIDLLNHYIFITSSCIKNFYLNNEAKDIVFNSILFHDKKKYCLFAAVIMDTHFHIIVEPYQKISTIMHSIKSFSAHKINKLYNRTGKIWLREYFDEIIHDDNDFINKMNYIINNPLKVNLDNYKWLYIKDDL